MANQHELNSIYVCCSTSVSMGLMEGGDNVPCGCHYRCASLVTWMKVRRGTAGWWSCWGLRDCFGTSWAPPSLGTPSPDNYSIKFKIIQKYIFWYKIQYNTIFIYVVILRLFCTKKKYPWKGSRIHFDITSMSFIHCQWLHGKQQPRPPTCWLVLSGRWELTVPRLHCATLFKQNYIL